MSNPFREKLNKGQVCAGVLTSMPSTNMAQMLSNSGFDWLFIDMEHGAIDIASCYNMITACLLYTSPSPRDYAASRMPSSA